MLPSQCEDFADALNKRMAERCGATPPAPAPRTAISARLSRLDLPSLEAPLTHFLSRFTGKSEAHFPLRKAGRAARSLIPHGENSDPPARGPHAAARGPTPLLSSLSVVSPRTPERMASGGGSGGGPESGSWEGG
jgi:hypothetical protein